MVSDCYAVIFAFAVHSDFVKIKVNPQRAKGIHRAEDNITATQYHAEGISLRKQQGCPSGRFSRRFAPQNDIKCFAQNTLSLKSQNFDEIVFFSAGSEKSSVLWRTRFFGFRRKSRISQNYDFLLTICCGLSPQNLSYPSLRSRCRRQGLLCR